MHAKWSLRVFLECKTPTAQHHFIYVLYTIYQTVKFCIQSPCAILSYHNTDKFITMLVEASDCWWARWTRTGYDVIEHAINKVFSSPLHVMYSNAQLVTKQLLLLKLAKWSQYIMTRDANHLLMIIALSFRLAHWTWKTPVARTCRFRGVNIRSVSTPKRNAPVKNGFYLKWYLASLRLGSCHAAISL